MKGRPSKSPEHSPCEVTSARKKSHSKTVMSRSRVRCCSPLRRKGGKRPALVFIHGSGAQSREMYWGLGYLYAARGFAVLAYDKRGVGKSTGNWREASFEDLADDAVAGAKFLQARTDIAANQIGFWGQSQGGWIAPWPLHVFPRPLSRSLCQAAACHQLTRSCLIASSS